MKTFNVEIRNISVATQDAKIPVGVTKTVKMQAESRHWATGAAIRRAFGRGVGSMLDTRNADGSETCTLTAPAPGGYSRLGRIYLYVEEVAGGAV